MSVFSGKENLGMVSGKSLTVLEAKRGFSGLGLGELWQYRDLLWMMASRDVRVRYKQSVLGGLWALIVPVAQLVVFTLVFGKMLGVAKLDDPVFLYAGLLPWTFFASSVNASTQSLVANAGILQKVYFPRLIVPLSSVGAPLVDYALAFLVLVGLMIWSGSVVSLSLLLLPLLVLMTIVAALGVGVLLASLTVRYRDFRHLVPFMVQVWFFLTPVLWTTQDSGRAIDWRWIWAVRINPMGGTIQAFRSCVLDKPIDWVSLGWSGSVAVLCLAFGVVIFKRSERSFADII